MCNTYYQTILLQTSLIDYLCDTFSKQDIGIAIKKISQRLWSQSYKQNENYDECMLLCDVAIDIMKWYTIGFDDTIMYHAKDIVQSFKRVRHYMNIIKHNKQTKS